MVQNQNYTNRTQGGAGRTTNKPPAHEIRVRTATTVVKDDCLFNIRVTLFLGKQPITGQEIILEEGISFINSDTTDVDGSVTFNIKEVCTDNEKIKTLYLRLTGTSDEKTLVLTVPAKKKSKKTTKKFKIKVVSTVDAKANECLLTFECTVFEDDQPFPHQPVILKRGVVKVGDGCTDSNGQITFQRTRQLAATERIATYRFCLENSPEEEELSVSIPAATPEKKVDNDPEHLVLMSHSDGKGHFRVKARITKFKGDTLSGIPFSVWCQGKNRVYRTNKQGEKAFDVPGTFKKGQEEQLVAMVSGIEERCKIILRRSKTFRKTFAEKFIKLAWFVALGLWILAVLVGPGRPLINPDVFRDKGLSASERFYNESAGVQMIKPATANLGHKLVDFCQKSIWLVAAIITILAILITIRVVVRAIIFRSEEALEGILHRSYDNAGDPMFEKMAKYVGAYAAVSRKPRATHVDQVAASEEPASGVISDNQPAEHKAEHKKGVERSSLFTFIGVDLLIEMAMAILKKTFSK